MKFLALVEVEVPEDTSPDVLSEHLRDAVSKMNGAWKTSMVRLHGLSFAEYEVLQSKKEKSEKNFREVCSEVMRTYGYLSREIEKLSPVREKMNGLKELCERLQGIR